MFLNSRWLELLRGVNDIIHLKPSVWWMVIIGINIVIMKHFISSAWICLLIYINSHCPNRKRVSVGQYFGRDCNWLLTGLYSSDAQYHINILLVISLGFPCGSVVKNPPGMQEMQVGSLGGEDPQEEVIATHSSVLTWRIPCTEEPGELQPMGSRRLAMTELAHTVGFREHWLFYTRLIWLKKKKTLLSL